VLKAIKTGTADPKSPGNNKGNEKADQRLMAALYKCALID